jgi:crotonobetainyl-CoA:carnitine CoA-transferase CaiB-like acyl-CoA transferase
MNKAKTSAGEGPLKGLKVIDAGTMIAGPLAATIWPISAPT